MRVGTEIRIIRFGSFEADIQEATLSKSGIRIRLQGQPFRILALLLDRPGQLVTREEIRDELWSNNTFVEFDKALNTAIGKLRAALNDSADNPRFVETVPRRGYRFVAPVTFVSPTPVGPERIKNESATIASPPLLEIASVQPALAASPFGKTGIRNLIAAAALALLLAAGIVIYWYKYRPGFQITSKDTVVLADFVNTTGETVFEDALRQGLEVGLEQSPFVKILPDRKMGTILKQMGHSLDERTTGRTAIEVCQRAGGKVTVQGSIASLGTAYLIGLAALRCDTGEPIANEQEQARRKEDVVDALGQATSSLRARLGESLPSIQKYNAPLELATTASLDALNAYGQALSTWDKKGDVDSLPVFKRAIELDPNFAMAYGALAVIYHNLGEFDLARENASKSYELRTRVTEREKVMIEARYYAYVTGELEKAEQVHAAEVQNFPDSPSAYNHLASVEGELAQNDWAEREFRKALLLDPTRVNTYVNLANVLLALNKVDQASAVLAEAAKRNLQADSLLQANYWIAFLRNDSAEMQKLLDQSKQIPGAQALLLAEQSNTDAFHGRFGKAREFSRAAAIMMERDGDKESAASCLVQAAVRESEVGSSARAAEFIAQAMKLPHGLDVITLTALSMAEVGDLKGAEKQSHQLNKEWPLDTYVQKYWLPLIRAEVDLHGGRPSKAIDDLNMEMSSLELASPSTLPVTALYPAYVRGQAFLSMGDGQKALAEFQKFTDHIGVVANDPVASLARLGLARAYSQTGDPVRGRQACADFFQLWKDADSDLPILKQAKKECAKQ
jgi:DNA-binding winged helix-turn-helix (wHTH) protein/predicted Zn-dependent protease